MVHPYLPHVIAVIFSCIGHVREPEDVL